MALWDQLFKLFTYAYTPDPLSKKLSTKDITGAGISQPDAIIDVRGASELASGAGGYIRVQNELIDLTQTTNRQNRYKEYERLIISVAEIEMALTVFADEACVSGDTLISTVYNGLKSIEWLVQNYPEERFPIYCYDFEKNDYTIGWAFSPRFVKKAETIKIALDNGKVEIITPDHRILKRDGSWIEAGKLKYGDELMPFYKIKANQTLTNIKFNQFPRIYTFNKGWIHERQFIDEWRLGRDIEEYERLNYITQLVAGDLTARQIMKTMNTTDWGTIQNCMHKNGFTYKEIKFLAKNPDKRRVIGVHPHKEIDVYDLSVEGHENFCTNSLIMHNCQKDEDGRVFKIQCENKEVLEEAEHLCFHRDMLNLDQRNMWDKAKRLFVKGDAFWEVVIDPDDPKAGIFKIQDLPPETMYRIETTRGKLLEFQQGKEGPDYQAIQKAPPTQASDQDLQQAIAIRFSPDQIIHLRIGDYRKSFYPYGVSLVESARGPAHQLRMMEDSMVVYRLTRAPERRIFYIDVGQLPPFKAEAFIERMKDQFRKKKVVNNLNRQTGPNAVEERWHAPAVDEDYWLPIRPNSNTKIDTLPGASNLGEIDDTVYFRNKLFTALNFPKNYFSMEDPNATRITLSAQDVKFARYIERLQSHIEDAIYEIIHRHLTLRGYPPESYEDLSIKMTPPSDWRELSRAEIVTNRINNANSLKGSQLLSDYDILTLWMKYTIDEANEMIARMKIQKLEDLKLQVLAQNPQLLGVGIPGQGEQEIGTEPGGPSPMLGPEGTPPPGGTPPEGGMPPPGPEGMPPPEGGMPPPPAPEVAGKEQPGMAPPKEQAEPLPDPTDEDIVKYNLEIEDYEAEMDEENPDYSETEE